MSGSHVICRISEASLTRRQDDYCDAQRQNTAERKKDPSGPPG